MELTSHRGYTGGETWLRSVPTPCIVYLRDGFAEKVCLCHAEIEETDQTCYFEYSDPGPTSPITDPITPSHWHGGLLCIIVEWLVLLEWGQQAVE